MTDDTVFARCVALDASTRLNERLIGWSGRWSLMGDFVICTQCITAQGIDQGIDQADKPFEHLPGCVASQYGLHPWHELQRLLSQIPALSKEHLH